MDEVKFYIIRSRPVKLFKTAEGGLDIGVYHAETHEFLREWDYYLLVDHEDTQQISESEFLSLVKSKDQSVSK